MTYAELTRKLRRLGCVFARQARGSHEIWANDKTGATSPIPRHGNRDLKPGTLLRIIRNLGITKEELDRA
ncbi:MAG: type II toxin-antitoxin system HicA family toxin [Chloroflexota bacterium]|nr:type II toxin-antitoxin system HicA family toxin [Chloroflexota bacterium]MDE2901177.1 type II toxin-antitoxin system HicA family toxin [Chloroflexota bacterium]MDE2968598.1 type II toxin-antitoxin system HicA family toxin [Chloroflexota bacterium]